MKTRIPQFIPMLLVLLSLGFDRFSLWCVFTVRTCYGTWVSHIDQYFTQPLYFFALYSLPLVIILIFVSRPVFKSWLKLATWLLPLAFIFIATQPVNWTGIGINPFFISRDDMARYSAEVFSVLSFILIIYKAYTSRRGSSVKG